MIEYRYKAVTVIKGVQTLVFFLHRYIIILSRGEGGGIICLVLKYHGIK